MSAAVIVPADEAPPATEDQAPTEPKKAAKKAAAKKAAGAAGDKRPAGAGRGPGRPSAAQRLEDDVTTLLVTITTAGMFATGDPMHYAQHGRMPAGSVGRDFEIINAKSRDLARILVRIGERNAVVKTWLERLVNTGNYSEAMMVVGGIAVAIMANHGLVPEHLAALLGAPPATDAPPA